jgi:hypothetical protein
MYERQSSMPPAVTKRKRKAAYTKALHVDADVTDYGRQFRRKESKERT